MQYHISIASVRTFRNKGRKTRSLLPNYLTSQCLMLEFIMIDAQKRIENKKFQLQCFKRLKAEA